MHGGTLALEAVPACVAAMREKPFAYAGRLLGRELPLEAPALT